jgi:trehalose 6-phosphate synthase/phosphatase
LDGYTKRALYDAYRHSSKRLLLLDYDGTLVPFSSNPEHAVPGKSLLSLLKNLSEARENEVYVISGRSSSWLEKQFGGLPLHLIAEHGARYKKKNGEWVTEVHSPGDWKEQVNNSMEMYVRRCAGSTVEEKEFSVVWHYRNCNVEQGKLRAYELANELNEFIRNRQLQVLMGNKIVEVRHSGVNKGSCIKKIIEAYDHDFIFAAGDDRTDEDMFKELINSKNTFTIKVGSEASYAQYNLHTPRMVVSLLEGLNYLTSPVLT